MGSRGKKKEKDKEGSRGKKRKAEVKRGKQKEKKSEAEGNVLKVRLSCVKPSEKNREKKISKKITVRRKKSRSGYNIYPCTSAAAKSV